MPYIDVMGFGFDERRKMTCLSHYLMNWDVEDKERMIDGVVSNLVWEDC